MRGGTSARSGGSAGSLGLFTFIFIVLELITWVWCTFQQVATTHDSAFGLLQGGIMINSHMTAQELQLFIMGSMDKYNKISYTIALVTQVVFLSALMPNSPMHNQNIRRIVGVIFFILEVTSDLWYSAATGTTLGGAFSWVFNFSNGGWLASFMYIVAMAAGSTIIGIDAFNRLGRLIASMRGA
jgi:hypothetical protein